MASVKCQTCNNVTTNPSGFCYLHDRARTGQTAARGIKRNTFLHSPLLLSDATHPPMWAKNEPPFVRMESDYNPDLPWKQGTDATSGLDYLNEFDAETIPVQPGDLYVVTVSIDPELLERVGGDNNINIRMAIGRNGPYKYSPREGFGNVFLLEQEVIANENRINLDELCTKLSDTLNLEGDDRFDGIQINLVDIRPKADTVSRMQAYEAVNARMDDSLTSAGLEPNLASSDCIPQSSGQTLGRTRIIGSTAGGMYEVVVMENTSVQRKWNSATVDEFPETARNARRIDEWINNDGKNLMVERAVTMRHWQHKRYGI